MFCFVFFIVVFVSFSNYFVVFGFNGMGRMWWKGCGVRGIIKIGTVKIFDFFSEHIYRRSRVSSTWERASSDCRHFGGKLANLHDLNRFSKTIRDQLTDVDLESKQELWVGGHLIDEGWKWEGEKKMPFEGTCNLIWCDRGYFFIRLSVDFFFFFFFFFCFVSNSHYENRPIQIY